MATMQQASIEQIDRAALVLLQALAEHREALARYFEPGHLEGLEGDLTILRQALLGLQMGPLYWDAPGGEGEQAGGEDAGSGCQSSAVLTGSEDDGGGR
jgi:hypothetical protein